MTNLKRTILGKDNSETEKNLKKDNSEKKKKRNHSENEHFWKGQFRNTTFLKRRSLNKDNSGKENSEN